MSLTFYKTFFTAGTLLLSPLLQAQDEGFIFGKVTTEDNRVYEGPIRWGKEEVYWNDIFNASKLKNENLKYLSDRDRERLDERRHDEWFSWAGNFKTFASHHWNGDDENDYVHQFSCQFGEIKSLRPRGRKYAELELKNGQVFEVSGEGYNDVGLDIKVMDKDLGEVEIYWGRVEKIEFTNTPASLVSRFGKPLYGTVEAYGGKFTGYIQWDHDERLSTDKLDGDSDDGDVAIEFGKIKSIERTGGRSLVVLKSGRELTLDGSNDVSSGHRGVIIMNKEFPSINVPWDEFDKVVFEENAPGPVASYNQYPAQKELSGKVTTHSGKSFEGTLVYDLDEAYEYELLQGKEGEFEYVTAFRSVKRITTKGEHRCLVELKSGKKITLDEGQDVNEKHQGVLVFAKGKENPAYIPWEDVNEIEFK
jgi:hypothetical protein